VLLDRRESKGQRDYREQQDGQGRTNVTCVTGAEMREDGDREIDDDAGCRGDADRGLEQSAKQASGAEKEQDG
jgi:hypothetical protein